MLSRATQKTAIHEARLIMSSLELLGGCLACFCSSSSSRGSRGSMAFMFAFPGTLLFMMDGVGEDITEAGTLSFSLSFSSITLITLIKAFQTAEFFCPSVLQLSKSPCPDNRSHLSIEYVLSTPVPSEC